MAFKFTKTELSTLDNLINNLRIAEEAFTAAQEKNENLIERAAELIVVVNEAEEFRSDIVERLQNEFDDKSETWQESDKGDEVTDFISEWDSVSFDEPELTDLANLELDDYADNLEGLPTEV